MLQIIWAELLITHFALHSQKKREKEEQEQQQRRWEGNPGMTECPLTPAEVVF